MNKFSKSLTVGIAILSSVVLASKAEAIIYEFENYNPGGGDVTANGFFDLSTSAGETINWATDVNSFSITLSGDGSDVTFDQFSQITVNTLNTASISGDGNFFTWGTPSGSNTELKFQGVGLVDFKIKDNSSGFGIEEIRVGGDRSELQVLNSFGGGFIATASTPVPFELDATLGLLAVGGIWGVSRLRKTRIAARSSTVVDKN